MYMYMYIYISIYTYLSIYIYIYVCMSHMGLQVRSLAETGGQRPNADRAGGPERGRLQPPPCHTRKPLGSPRFPLKGSFKGDIGPYKGYVLGYMMV